MNAAVLLLAILAMGDSPLVVTESVDLVELNHFYDGDGKQIFEQLLFYRWEGTRYRMIDWRLVKSRECLPFRQLQGWVSLWHDKEELRRVRAASYRETWTQWDPELVDRETNPHREGLLKAPQPSRVSLPGK